MLFVCFIFTIQAALEKKENHIMIIYTCESNKSNIRILYAILKVMLQALLSVNIANRLIKYIEIENLIDESHTSFPKKKKLV